jgi:hypothetical protein
MSCELLKRVKAKTVNELAEFKKSAGGSPMSRNCRRG